MLDILSVMFSVTGIAFKVVDVGAKFASVNDERAAAAHLLTLTADSADDLQELFKQHSAFLDRPTRTRIERELSRANELLAVYKKALKREVIEDEVLELMDKLAWVFRDKDRVLTYYTMMNRVGDMLENLSSEIRTAVRMARLLPVTTMINTGVQDCEATPPMKVALSENELHTKYGTGETSVSLIGEMDDKKSTIEFELSISADLKKRFKARALALQGSNPIRWVEEVKENIEADFELYSPLTIKEDLRRRYKQRAVKFVEHFAEASDGMGLITEN